jgi:hypothetical protein
MDFGRVLGRAWEIVWRWKILWLLGFLGALGQGTSGANTSYQFGGQDLQNGNLPDINWPVLGGALAALACLGLLVGIALLIVSIIARGGLIAGVAQVEDEGSTSFARAWAVGATRFWTLFGISVLVALPIILLVLVMLAGIFAFAGGTAILTSQGDQSVGPIIGGLFACLCPGFCLIFVLAIVLSQIQIYAERAAILEGLNWTAAFSRGWQVLKANLGPTVVLWLIFLVLGLVIGAIILAITVPILLPLVALFGRDSNVSSAAVWIPVCGLGLLATILGAIVNSVVTAFTSATWTLAYRQLTAPLLPPPLSPLSPDEPSPVTTVEP